LKINDLQNKIINATNIQTTTTNYNSNNQNLNNQSVITTNINNRDQSIAELSIIFKKILKMDNNLNIIRTHINNKTTPKSLNHQNFPKPFLWHNESYIAKYNVLIEKFQNEIMLFNLKEIENNKLIALDKIKILRMNMQLSNLFPDLSKIIQSNFKIVKQILQKISRKVTKKLKMS
jgi:hypothetical protein